MGFHLSARPHVADRVITQILHLAEHRGDNPLDLQTPDRMTRQSTDQIQKALIRPNPDQMQRMAQSLETAHGTTDFSRGSPDATGDLDEITARLILHQGLNPLTVAWMARSGEGVEVMIGGETMAEVDIWTAADDPDCTTRVHLGRDVSWLTRGALALVDHTVPDTVACALPGRYLTTVFRHPVLDGMGLTVSEVDTGGGRRRRLPHHQRRSRASQPDCGRPARDVPERVNRSGT
jgi:hypothetical protein